MINNREHQRQIRELAAKFVLIPDFPRQDGAIDTLADMVVEISDTFDEAKWLAAEALKWEKWRGIAGLEELLNGRRMTAPERKVFHSAPPPAEVLCPICKGWGHLWDEALKKTVLCSCPEGSHPSAVGLVEAMNRKKVKGNLMQKLQGSPERRPVTEMDLYLAKKQNVINHDIADARAVLASEEASAERKEIARQTLKNYEAGEHQAS